MTDLRARILWRMFHEADLFVDKLCRTLTNRWTLLAMAAWLAVCIVGSTWGAMPA